MYVSRIIFIILIIFFVVYNCINPSFINLDEFNEKFDSKMIILPNNFAAFGYNNYQFYVYCTNKHNGFLKILHLILNYWIYNIHSLINKKEYYFVITLNDGYREKIPYKDIVLTPYIPKYNSFANSNDIINIDDDKYPILHKNKYILCFSKRINDPSAICFPDIYYILHKGYKQMLNNIDNNLVKWDNKINKLIYRGNNNNGYIYNFIDYKDKNKNPRQYFCEKFKNNKFIDLNNNKLSKSKQIKYKYILDIDGYTNSWEGTVWKLYSGSVVIKQKSIWKQWYYDELHEWIHYVPVNNDFSNLEVIINWCINNDSICKQIAKNSRKFIKEKLNNNYVLNKISNDINIL
jgi:hypothetical protein